MKREYQERSKELLIKDLQLKDLQLKECQTTILKIKKIVEGSNSSNGKLQELSSQLVGHFYQINWEELEVIYKDLPSLNSDKISNLSITERRLVVLISLGLSNKEIAGITKKSDRALTVAKKPLEE